MPVGVAVNATGVYLVAYNPESGNSFVRKYTGDGEEVWTHSFAAREG